jgi:hypothetical protein
MAVSSMIYPVGRSLPCTDGSETSGSGPARVGIASGFAVSDTWLVTMAVASVSIAQKQAGRVERN